MTAPLLLVIDEMDEGPTEVYLDCPECGCLTLHHEFATAPTDTDSVTYRAFQCQEH